MNQDKQLNSKGQFGTRFGFLMSAIGSAVGLGNLWGFPYKMGAYGGFAFLVLYLILVIFVGYVIMLTELSLGRRTGKGVIEAYKAISKKYAFIGWMGLIAPWLILSFYSMLGGYCIKYAVANLGDLFGAGWGVGVFQYIYIGHASVYGLYACICAPDRVHSKGRSFYRNRKIQLNSDACSVYHACDSYNQERDITGGIRRTCVHVQA